MNRVPRPSPAMVVAIVALIVAIGGTAFALPGKFTVGRDDLKKSSVGARSIGKMLLDHRRVIRSEDPVSGDGQFTETRGYIKCPAKAPTAIDPSVGGLSPTSHQSRINSIPNRWGGPLGYEIIVSGDEGPDVGYTMKVNCLFTR